MCPRHQATQITKLHTFAYCRTISYEIHHFSCPQDMGNCSKRRNRLSVFSWRLQSAWHMLNQLVSWPSLSYNTRTRTAIIEWMPLDIPESLAYPFSICDFIAKRDLRPDVASRMVVRGPQYIRAFKGAYTGSSKAPDVLFKSNQPNNRVSYSTVVEIGFLERYQELVDDVTLDCG